MADLKQALFWLGEDKKVRRSKWPKDQFIRMDGGVVTEKGQPYCIDELDVHDKWEIYIPEPQYNPNEAALKNRLEDHEEYIVWDKMGNRAFAFWSSHDQCFHDLYNGYGFALDVVEWVKIPKRKGATE